VPLLTKSRGIRDDDAFGPPPTRTPLVPYAAELFRTRSVVDRPPSQSRRDRSPSPSRSTSPDRATSRGRSPSPDRAGSPSKRGGAGAAAGAAGAAGGGGGAANGTHGTNGSIATNGTSGDAAHGRGRTGGAAVEDIANAVSSASHVLQVCGVLILSLSYAVCIRIRVSLTATCASVCDAD
jgi:hypothetical protein